MTDQLVSDEVMATWTVVDFPVLATDVYAFLGYQNYYYEISAGLFAYDTTVLEYYLSSYSDTAFDAWSYVYDGMSLGLNMYFQYYYFESSESFGACIANYCGGVWQYYDT